MQIVINRPDFVELGTSDVKAAFRQSARIAASESFPYCAERMNNAAQEVENGATFLILHGSVESDPTDPDVIYVTTWDYEGDHVKYRISREVLDEDNQS